MRKMLQMTISVFLLNVLTIVVCGQDIVSYIDTPGGKTSFCPFQTVTLVATTSDDQQDMNSQSWSGNMECVVKQLGNILIVKFSQGGQYNFKYTATTRSGKNTSSSITLNIFPEINPTISIINNKIEVKTNFQPLDLKYHFLLNDKTIDSKNDDNVTLSGIYKVMVTDKNGCSQTSNSVSIK